MKLKNRITGEVRNAKVEDDGIYLYDETTEQWYKYALTLLGESWEYYVKPNIWYAINEFNAEPMIINEDTCAWEDEEKENYKLLGNYFKTEAEAQKAIEKLKAIKILKDYDLQTEFSISPEYDKNDNRWRCSVDFSVRAECDGDKLFNLLFKGDNDGNV